MSIKYGHKWSSYIGDDKEVYQEIEREWSMQLAKFNLEQIKNALDVVLDNFPEWPPGVGEFKALCSVGDRSWETKKPQLALDNPSKDSTVEAAIAEMKEILI